MTVTSNRSSTVETPQSKSSPACSDEPALLQSGPFDAVFMTPDPVNARFASDFAESASCTLSIVDRPEELIGSKIGILDLDFLLPLYPSARQMLSSIYEHAGTDVHLIGVSHLGQAHPWAASAMPVTTDLVAALLVAEMLSNEEPLNPDAVHEAEVNFDEVN